MARTEKSGQTARAETSLKTPTAEQMTTTVVQTGLKTPTAEQMTTTVVQTGLKTPTVEQMTTRAAQTGLKTPTVEQTTTTAVQMGLKTPTVEQMTTAAQLPLRVPWRDQRHTAARRRIAAGFCYNVRCTWKQTPTCSKMREAEWHSSSPCSQDKHCNGLSLFWESNAPVTGSVSAFCSHLKEVFGQHAAELSVHDQLFNIRQGKRETASSYAFRFRTLACISGWNETALITAFRHGLRDETLVYVNNSHSSISVQALIDSGSAGNFISQQTLQRLNARRQRCPVDLRITTIQGKPLGRGRVRHFSPTLTLRIGHLHEETITFMVLEESTADIILGRPWLNLHQPHLHWSSGEILKWGENCFQNSITRPIKVRPKSSPVHQQLPVQSTSVESPDTHVNVTIPPAYWAFQDVFSKRLATNLPPHRPWDCAIDLLPGATLPKGRIYPLSIPEQQAMENEARSAPTRVHKTIYLPCRFKLLLRGKKGRRLAAVY
ncbi:Retrotransposon-derived protein PEG10 [Anabarilius grahami]|uniref:Retrotransposon-derived protein PEG10 n=1 Tax=Anabarilius grahami TaxID=495550 RepID=A0A3N0Y887_ANAGA|nr:Retrotransposon-derived protein PEG10 [Anabarilius grahami]